MEFLKKTAFWIKFITFSIIAIILFIFIKNNHNIVKYVKNLFGFGEKNQKVNIGEIKKVETGQGKTEKTIDYLIDIKNKYKL